jgi:transposase, IS5 family
MWGMKLNPARHLPGEDADMIDQPGLFDLEFRLRELRQGGDPLVRLAAAVDFEIFRPVLELVHEKERKSNAGRPPFDVVRMFKILVLQSLYNLSDDAIEFQIRDRISFMRFLGLGLRSTVPDAKTIWLFRDQLTALGLHEDLFERFDRHLTEQGFAARKGQIIDASIVEAPRQRNTREENKQIKAGQRPAGWSEPVARQKDLDARWVKKNGVAYYGYKNHVSVDVKHKFIRDWIVTDASEHDSQIFEQLLDPANTSADVWADSAYRSAEKLGRLSELGYREHIQRKGVRGRPLTEREKQGNRTRARVRARVEHVFGIQLQRAGTLLVRTIGIGRARCKIGLRNLTYNLTRFARLRRQCA